LRGWVKGECDEEGGREAGNREGGRMGTGGWGEKRRVCGESAPLLHRDFLKQNMSINQPFVALVGL